VTYHNFTVVTSSIEEGVVKLNIARIPQNMDLLNQGTCYIYCII